MTLLNDSEGEDPLRFLLLLFPGPIVLKAQSLAPGDIAGKVHPKAANEGKGGPYYL